MPAQDAVYDRIAALELLNDHVPEIRGQLQFMDFLVRAVMADLERYHSETDPGTRIFLKQLILMHLNHLDKNGGNTGSLGEFMEAVHHWLSFDENDVSEIAATNDNMSVQELINSAVETLNMSGGRI